MRPKNWFRKTVFAVFSCAFAVLAFTGAAQSQSFRYMDDAGNIYWVDRLDQVPGRYRSQIVAPPPPITDKKVLKKLQKQIEKERKLREKEKKKKKKRANPIPRPKKGKKDKEKTVEPAGQVSEAQPQPPEDALEEIPQHKEKGVQVKAPPGKKDCNSCHDKGVQK